MNTYLVKLHMQIGQYGKRVVRLITASGEQAACKQAMLNEAHNELDWVDDSFTAAFDSPELYYSVYDVNIVDNRDVGVLSRYFSISMAEEK